MKYQEALDTLTDWFHSYTDNGVRVHERHITPQYEEAKKTLQELINKWTELGCELSNLPFFDDECKLKTIEFIERIYYDK